jgi:ubiquinone/menaquinone biosynthesis C-methylase UbiE
MTKDNTDEIRQNVRKTYGSIAKGTPGPSGSGALLSCCGGSVAIVEARSKMMGYSDADLVQAPEPSNLGLGCGNPGIVASLMPGETVLDLGSGGGFDCFLAARAVGETGKVIGVDMTPEMIGLARQNAEKTGFQNVEFRLGGLENLPVAESSVDVVMSNCVINLSPEKPAVFQEAFRVLKPGGRLAVSDVVAIRPLPEDFKIDPELVCGCVGGAASVAQVEVILKKSGFTDISIEFTEQGEILVGQWFPGRKAENYVRPVMIRALKP